MAMKPIDAAPIGTMNAVATVVAAGLLALHHRTAVAGQPSAAAGRVAEVRGVEGSASQVA